MATEAERRDQALADFRKRLLKHKEIDTKVRGLRDTVKELKKDYDKTEDDLKALQSVGQIIGEVLRQLDEERCEYPGCPCVAFCARSLGRVDQVSVADLRSAYTKCMRC